MGRDGALSGAPLLPATLLRARDIMMSEIRAHTAGAADVLVQPRVSNLALRRFREGTSFVEAGEASAEEVLPLLRQRLPWLG